MTKKIRYLILAACIVFFLLAAPATLLYVRGIAYDRETGSFYKTGILSVKSVPKDVQIKLDGVPYGQNIGTLRFIKPKEYVISLVKPGFQTWSKRLPIESARVTWANPSGQNIFLFFDKPPEQTVSEETNQFLVRGEKIFFSTPGELAVASFSSPENITAFPLSGPIEKITAIPGGELLALKTKSTSTPWQIFDSAQNTFLATDKILNDNTEIKFQNGGELYVLEQNSLVAITLADGKKTPILDNIKDAFYEDGYFYYLLMENNGISFYTSSTLGQPGILLAKKLPLANSARIILNNQKRAFVLLDQNFYQIASLPILLAENVKSLRLNPNKDVIALTTGSEFLSLGSGDNKANLVSRSLYPIIDGVILPGYGYGFLAKENIVIAKELDARDRQNEFTLYSGKGPLNFSVSDDAKKLVVLDNHKLKILTIR